MLNPKPLKHFFKKGKLLTYRKGQIIIQSNKSPGGVYYIDRGYIQLFANKDEEEIKLHAIYKKGEIFPLIWTLVGIKKELCYKALNQVVIYKRTKKEFISFITRDLDAALEVIDKLALLLNVLMDRLDNLETVKARPRLAGRLLFFANRFGTKRNGKITIGLPITQTQIAHSIAMTRETASRELKGLEKKGLIKYQSNFIVIDDEKKLMQELLQN